MKRGQQRPGRAPLQIRRARLDVFISGTDTGIGKTFVTGWLLGELRRRGLPAAGFKPISCGAGGRADARLYRQLMDEEASLDQLNPVYLRHPLAPQAAARLERRRIDLSRIQAAYRRLKTQFSPILVEGAGGLLVPIQRDYFIADLARDLKLPVVIVARLGLGTLNHTLLTVRQAQATGLRVRGIILNDLTGARRGLAERTNITGLPQLTGVPLLGVIPFRASATHQTVRTICDQLFGSAG
jgi:dethiobiotin synthetase